jgi:predicted esterase
VVPEIRNILRKEAQVLGSEEAPAWERVILAGISMGAATGVHVLFNLDAPRLGAFIGFSCRCPFVGRSIDDMRRVLSLDAVPEHDEVIRNTPILLEHCVDDPLVKVENGRLMRDALKGFGATVHSMEYPQGGHWFNSPRGMDDVIAFLSQVLSA